MNEWDKRKFEKVLYEKEDVDYIMSLKFLSDSLYKYYGEKVIIFN